MTEEEIRNVQPLQMDQCDDAISRYAAIHAMCSHCPVYDCINRCPAYYALYHAPSVEPLQTDPREDAISRQAVKEQMIKYGFQAPDMTVTEFVEQLPSMQQDPKTCSECKEIRVGDEVYGIDPRHKRVVTKVIDRTENAVCISSYGEWSVNKLSDLHKTGRHFPEISEVLNKLK